MAKTGQPPALKLVLDTNIYMAAALNPDSLLYKIVKDSAARQLAKYASSEAILLELQHKLETKFLFERRQVVTWINELRATLEIVHPTQRLEVVTRDPDDNKVLECALEAGADLIISADRDLLILKTYRDIKIMHPSSFKYVFPALGSEQQ